MVSEPRDSTLTGKVLVIDDDEAICEMLYRTMHGTGLEVRTATDAQEGLETALRWRPDVLLLDIMIPGIDGLEICRRIRDAGLRDLGIVVLSARTLTQDKVDGLDAGADDYLTKPFRSAELLARVRAQLRRRGLGDQLLRFEDLSLDAQGRVAMWQQEVLPLTAKELDLLRLFLVRPGKVLDRSFLMEEVWGANAEVESNVLDVYVGRLRRKLDVVSAGVSIRAIRTMGYMLSRSARPSLRPGSEQALGSGRAE